MQSAKTLSENAVQIIKRIYDSLGPEHTAYLVFPNAVLTLAGARGAYDAVFYHDDKRVLNAWLREINDIDKILSSPQELTLQAAIDTNPGGQTGVIYEIVYKAGLKNTLPDYSFLGQQKVNEILESPLSDQLIGDVMEAARLNKEIKDMPKDKIGAIAWGVLMGYPEKAIMCAVEFWFAEQDRFALELIPAAIRGADYYHCPQPVYYYPRELVNDPEINRHEHLWSDILKGYYKSDFHKKLEKDPKFQNKLSELTRY